MPNAIAFHPLGVTCNGLHSTTTPTPRKFAATLR
jgi:hypothetical protein